MEGPNNMVSASAEESLHESQNDGELEGEIGTCKEKSKSQGC